MKVGNGSYWKLKVENGSWKLEGEVTRMAARRVDAVLLTDSNVLLSGIMTDKVCVVCVCVCVCV